MAWKAIVRDVVERAHTIDVIVQYINDKSEVVTEPYNFHPGFDVKSFLLQIRDRLEKFNSVLSVKTGLEDYLNQDIFIEDVQDGGKFDPNAK